MSSPSSCTEAQSPLLVGGAVTCVDAPYKCALKYPQAGALALWTVSNSTHLCVLAPSATPAPPLSPVPSRPS